MKPHTDLPSIIKRLVTAILFFYCGNAYSQIKVACIGNSITYGYGADDPGSYPTKLGNILGKGWEVRNFGVPGATLLRNGDAPYEQTQSYARATTYQPDVIIIKLGTNDSKPQNWKYQQEFITDYSSLIADLQQMPSQPFIVICTPVPAYSHGWDISDSIIRLELLKLDTIATRANQETKALVNLYEPLSNHTECFPDGVHPDEQGYTAIAKTIGEKLKQWKNAIQKRNNKKNKS